MHCPHCQSKKFKSINKKTTLGYKQYNERTGSKLNFIEYPTEVVMLVTYHYYRFKVSLDDVVELMAMRGIYLSHHRSP